MYKESPREVTYKTLVCAHIVVDLVLSPTPVIQPFGVNTVEVNDKRWGVNCG